MRRTALLPLLLLAACSGRDADAPAQGQGDPAPTFQPPAPAAPPASTPPLPPAVSLAGEWRVAAIDGAPIEGDYAIALSADEARIWWEPACSGQGRRFAISGNTFRPVPPPASLGEVCDIGYPAELPDIWRAIDAADRIERTASNGVLISGGGRSLLLFSQ